jgi:hypothetical protein
MVDGLAGGLQRRESGRGQVPTSGAHHPHRVQPVGPAPQYVAFTTDEKKPYMVFELAAGKNAAVSHNGYHVAVRLGDLIYDAYTGPLGMKLSDYLSRLHARNGIAWEVVSAP